MQLLYLSFFRENVHEDGLVLVWFELVALAFVELVLKFDPVQSESVEKAFKQVHEAKHEEGNAPEYWPLEKCKRKCNPGAFVMERTFEQQVKECLCKLRVR